MGCSLTITAIQEIQQVLSEAPMTYGKAVKYYRKLYNKSQVELAAECKVHDKTIRRIEKEEIYLSLDLCVTIIVNLGMKKDYAWDLINKAGLIGFFNTNQKAANPRIIYLRYMVDHATKMNLNECNNILKDNEMKPLTDGTVE